MTATLAGTNNPKAEKIHGLVGRLNRHRHEYYNLDAPSVPDAVYDRLYDELASLEKETGIIISSSPTQTVGYKAVSRLEKVTHAVPLLSLDKTKQSTDILSFLSGHDVLLMLKLDGLTVKLEYENGELVQASTRGDGDVGEVITHNMPAFQNVPLAIPYQGRLVVSGEAFISRNDFEQLKDRITDSSGRPYRNGRNLASGSARCLDANTCRRRMLSFLPFSVLEGIGELPDTADSKNGKLRMLSGFGFGVCPTVLVSPSISLEELESKMEELKDLAARQNIPIDGLVATYDSISYSRSCGRTGHHYKDGLAYKFEDDTHETILRTIEWTPGRTGEISPVAVFDSVEMDGCEVSRASLHNLTFIKELELVSGCRILVSKRNMIIPHVEENLDRGQDADTIPETCPCCGSKTRIHSRKADNGRIVETLHCDNLECGNRILRQFRHFASRKAMDLNGISEATLEKFIGLGYLENFQDIYHLDRHRDEITGMKGFGIKSYEKLWNAIERSRGTTFDRYLVAMDIPMVGSTASRELGRHFHGDLQAFESAAMGDFDFTCLDDFGETLDSNIHAWFQSAGNVALFRGLQKEMNFKEREEMIMEEKQDSIFEGRTLVVTGKLENFTRDTINALIISLGGKPGSSVTKKTDYLVVGEKAGSKLEKARNLGISVLTEEEFLKMSR